MTPQQQEQLPFRPTVKTALLQLGVEVLEETKGVDVILTAFLRFMREQPEVYEQVEAMALTMIREGGRKRFGVKAACERLRWASEIQSTDAAGFKVNNSFASMMSRLFAIRWPEHARLFARRKLGPQRQVI